MEHSQEGLEVLPSLQSSLTPITRTIARGGNYYTKAEAVKVSGEAYKKALLTSNFLTALKPSP